tara:strand:- start:77 stop:373 length:297 start_codon:yes stop_codon:yes gene_type:complete
MTVLLTVMLTACATSGDERPAVEPDPVIETRTEVVTVCPAELQLAIPASPHRPADAVIKASQSMLEYLAQRFSREELLEARLRDAAVECPLISGSDGG